jgi:hypothetical protein
VTVIVIIRPKVGPGPYANFACAPDTYIFAHHKTVFAPGSVEV